MVKQIAQVAPRRASSAVVRALLAQVEVIDIASAQNIVRTRLGRNLDDVRASDWVGPISDDQFASLYLACIEVIVGFSARREGRPPMIKEECDLLCHCLITSETLREVIERTRGFLKMLGGRGAVVTLQIRANTA